MIPHTAASITESKQTISNTVSIDSIVSVTGKKTISMGANGANESIKSNGELGANSCY
jgi:hypothetical protein